jgi:hypothetical protein
MLIGHAITLTSARTGSGEAPAITARLTGLTGGEARDGASIGVSLTGAPVGSVATYRWQQDGIDIPGATASTQVVAIGTVHADNGLLRCAVRLDGVEYLTDAARMRHAPGTLAIGDQPAWTVEDTAVALDASADGAGLVFSDYQLAGLPHLTIDEAAGTIAGSIDQAEYRAQSAGTATVTCRDQYGRLLSDDFAWSAVLRAPATAQNSLTPPDWIVGEAIAELDVTSAFTPNGNTLSYDATGLPAGLIITSNGAISGMPTALESGTVTITGIDEFGRETTSTFTFGTSYPLQATAADGLGPFLWTVGSEVPTINVGTDFVLNGNTLTYTATGLPPDVAIAPDGTIDGTPTAVSSGPILITGTDTYGRETVSATSHTTALRPQATAAGALGPYGWPVGVALTDVSVTADFTDNGNTLTYTATGLPAGVTITSGGMIGGTPAEEAAGSIAVIGTDEYGRQTISAADYTTAFRTQATAAGGLGPFTWTVDDTVVAVTAANDFTANGNTLTYTATGLPEGVTITPHGTIGGTPAEASSGIIAITGTDEYGRETVSTASYSATLRAEATAAGLLGPFTWTVDDDTVNVSAAADFTANGNTLTFAATGLPEEVSIAPNGTIEGTPTVVSSGTIAITATDEYGRQTVSTTSHETALRPAATVTGLLGPFTWTVGVAITNFSVTDDFEEHRNRLSYSATGLPAGLTISASGSVSGTPTEASSGTIVFIATDEYGRETISTTSHTTTANVPNTYEITDEGDGTITATWFGTLDSITVGGGGAFDGTYTAFHDGTALINTHLAGVAGRGLTIGDTTGIGDVGQTLTAGANLVLHAQTDEPTVTIQWQRNGVDIAGATGATYTLVSADAGTSVRPSYVIASAGLASVTETGSAVAVAATAPAQMAAPGLAVASSSEIEVTLAADPDDGGAPITRYDIRHSTDATTWTEVIDITSPRDITGLPASTLHYVQARAVNAAGAGNWSASATATTAAATTAPEAITAGQWTATQGSAASQIDIGITAAPSDGGSPITGYAYSVDAGLTWAALGAGTTLPLNVTVDQHSDGTTGTLTAGASYGVKIRAVNALGSGPDSDTKTVLAGAAASGFTENAVVVNLGASIVADRGIDNMPGFLLFSSFIPISTAKQAIFNVARDNATHVYIDKSLKVQTDAAGPMVGQIKSFPTGVRHHVLMAGSCTATEATIRTAIWDAQGGAWTISEDVVPYTGGNLNLQEDSIRLFARTTGGDGLYFRGSTFRQAYWDFDTESDVPDVTTTAVQDLFASGASLVDPVTTQDQYASANIAGLSRLFFDIYGTAADLNSATIPQPGIATMSKFGSGSFA